MTAIRRRRAVVVATLVVGTAVLAGTLAAPSGGGLFFALGLLAAVVWIAGARLSGPVVWVRPGRTEAKHAPILGPLVLGVFLFGVFLAAKLIADQIPILSGSVASVLARADAGPRALVLLVALVNGVGEEMFFRGALFSAFGTRHAAFWVTVIYCGVTIATLNVALVAAALVMGTIFVAERRASGGVVAPLLTHLSWSALMLLLLPR